MTIEQSKQDASKPKKVGDLDVTGVRPGGVTRRSLLTGVGALGALGATAALAGPARATETALCRPADESVDVCVIGGGFAGLTAARDAVARGASALVLEARDRVGGRTLNGSLSTGEDIEEGGQWVGPGQDAVLELAREVGVSTFDTYNTGDNLLEYKGSISTYPAQPGIPPVGIRDFIEFYVALQKLNALAARVGSEAPWDSRLGRRFDRMTVREWEDEAMTTDGARFLFDVTFRTVLTVEPWEVSFLFFLAFVEAGGGYGNHITITGGAQESRFVGGSQLIPIRVAEELPEGTVRLNETVTRLEQCEGGVRVHSGGRTVLAEHVVCALPPTLAGRIQYDPILPARRDQLTQRMPQGSVVKVNVEYETPFWRAAGLSGQFIRDRGFATACFDNSPPSADVGVLVVFVAGDAARQFQQLPAAVRRRRILRTLARFFGGQAERPTSYIEKNWSDEEFTRGCYTAIVPPGGVVPFGPALREPIDRIHWAGTETADKWFGYMDGAVRSGRRAIAEIVGDDRAYAVKSQAKQSLV